MSPPGGADADSLWRGLAANYLGKAFTALLSLVTLPILYRQLGSEAFGLFGVFFSLQVLLAVFDFGVGAAMQRQLAAWQAAPGDPSVRHVLATLRQVERLLLGVSAGAVGIGWLAASWIARDWLQVKALQEDLVTRAIGWMAVAGALQFAASFHVGCLNGLRRHQATNLLQAATGLLRFVLVLSCVRVGSAPAGSVPEAIVPVLQAWAFANAVLLAGACFLLHRDLPAAGDARHRLGEALRYGLPLVAATTLIMLFNQAEKLAASKLLALETVGRYTIVWSIAEVMYLMYQPIYTSFLPVLCARHAAAARTADAAGLWHSAGLAWRVMTLVVLPVSALLLAVPGLVIHAWTGDAQLAAEGSAVLRWVIAGATVNAFLFIPFALQQAAGDLKPWAWRIAISLGLYVPLAIVSIRAWGMVGAASSWCLGSIAMAVWLARATGRSLPLPPRDRTLLAQLAPLSAPTLAACAVVAALAAWIPPASDRWLAGLLALAVLGACGVAAILAQRALLQTALRRWRG